MVEVGTGWSGWSGPGRMVGVFASVSLTLHHNVQKFSSGTGPPGWSRKRRYNGCGVVVWYAMRWGKLFINSSYWMNMQHHQMCIGLPTKPALVLADIVGRQTQINIGSFVSVLFTCCTLLCVGFCCWEYEDMEGALGSPAVQSPGASVSDGTWSTEWKPSRNQSGTHVLVSTITQLSQCSYFQHFYHPLALCRSRSCK